MKHRKINPMKAAVATVIIGSLSAVFFVSAKENNISLSSQIHASEVDMISSKQISSAETDLLSSESDSSLEDDLISAEENYSPEHNGISTIVSSVENKSGEETVSDNSSDENLNPWYRKYYPDLTDDDVRKIEAVHEANRRLIAEYESQNHKWR